MGYGRRDDDYGASFNDDRHGGGGDDRGGSERARNRDESRQVQGLFLGRHPAKAIIQKNGSLVDYAQTEQNKTWYALVLFQFTDGPNKGKTIEWKGWLSTKALPYTIENLRTCGWVGDDIDNIPALDNVIDLVLEAEDWQSERTGRSGTSVKIAFINAPGGGGRGVPETARVGRSELRAFAAQLKSSGAVNQPPPERNGRGGGNGYPLGGAPQGDRHPNEPGGFNGGSPDAPDDDIPF